MIQNQTKKNVKLIKTEVFSLQPDGTIISRNILTPQAYSTYIGHAKRYIEIPYSEFHAPDRKTPADQAFYYIKTNGLTKLRISSEKNYSG